MENNNQTINTLHQLLDYDARKFAIAEIHLKSVLPDWISKTSSLQLKTVLQRYLDFVNRHIEKLEGFYKEEEISSLSISNRIMRAFIDEAEEKFACCTGAPPVKDASLLAGIQTINHYKISTYGTAAAFALALGMQQQAAIFHEAEVNEKQIDDRLSQLAEHEVNIKANAPFELHT